MIDPTVRALRAGLRLQARRLARATLALSGAFAFGLLAAAWWAL